MAHGLRSPFAVSACGDVQRSTVGLATWVMFMIAAAAAVAGWIAVLA